MGRRCALWLAVLLLVCFVAVVQAETVTIETIYYDAAETQIKLRRTFVDGVLSAEMQFPEPGNTDYVMVYTTYEDDGITWSRRTTETHSVDSATGILSEKYSTEIRIGGSHVTINKYNQTGSGKELVASENRSYNTAGMLTDEELRDALDNYSRLTNEYAEDGVTLLGSTTRNGTWQEGETAGNDVFLETSVSSTGEKREEKSIYQVTDGNRVFQARELKAYNAAGSITEETTRDASWQGVSTYYDYDEDGVTLRSRRISKSETDAATGVVTQTSRHEESDGEVYETISRHLSDEDGWHNLGYESKHFNRQGSLTHVYKSDGSGNSEATGYIYEEDGTTLAFSSTTKTNEQTDPATGVVTESTSTLDSNGVKSSTLERYTEAYDEDGTYHRDVLYEERTSYNAADKLIASYLNKGDGVVVSKEYQYQPDGVTLISSTERTTTLHSETGIYHTDELQVSNGGLFESRTKSSYRLEDGWRETTLSRETQTTERRENGKLERTVSRTESFDDEGIFQGSVEEETAYSYTPNGSLSSTTISITSMDKNGHEKRQDICKNAEGQVLSEFSIVYSYDEEHELTGSRTESKDYRYEDGVLAYVSSEQQSYDMKTLETVEEQEVADAKGVIVFKASSRRKELRTEGGNYDGEVRTRREDLYDIKTGEYVRSILTETTRKYSDHVDNRKVTAINDQDHVYGVADRQREGSLNSYMASAEGETPAIARYEQYSYFAAMNGDSGLLEASIKLERLQERDGDGMVTSHAKLTNQDGILIATAESTQGVDEATGTDRSLEQRAYYYEQDGKLRETVESIRQHTEDASILTETVKDAAGKLVRKTITTSATEGVQETEVIERYDVETGKLLSTQRKVSDGFRNVVASMDAEGRLVSSVEESFMEGEDGQDLSIMVKKDFDPVTGKLLDQFTYRNSSEYNDELGESLYSHVTLNAQDQVIAEYSRQPVLDEEGNLVAIVWLNKQLDPDGKLIYYRESTTTSTRDEKTGYQIGSHEVTRNEKGEIVEDAETVYELDDKGVSVRNVTTTRAYDQGALVSTSTSIYQHADGVSTTQRVDAKGMLLEESLTQPRRDFQGTDLERADVRKAYSRYTGNLMTTTTVKTTTTDQIDAFVREEQVVRADGQLARTSYLSHMKADEYGYLNYQSHYTDYLYRHDGTLKYEKQGVHSFDNYLLGKYLNNENRYFWLDQEPYPTETVETTTTGEGVLAAEYHYKLLLPEGLDRAAVEDSTKETKRYDEQTGTLKSITTETAVYNSLSRQWTNTVETVNADGKLIYSEVALSQMSLDYGTNQVKREAQAFDNAGNRTMHITTDAEGEEREERRVFSTDGKLLISTTTSGDRTETITYGADGSVLSRGLSENNSHKLYNAQGDVIASSTQEVTENADGSVTTSGTTITLAGQTLHSERLEKPNEDGELVPIRSSYQYVDADGQVMQNVTEGMETRTYNASGKLIYTTISKEDGTEEIVDAAGKLMYYTLRTDHGDEEAFYANGKPRVVVQRDDDGAYRYLQFDEDGYISIVKATAPASPFTMYYDGNGKLIAAQYSGTAGSAYYDAGTKQWYNSVDERVAIATPEFADELDQSDIKTGGKARPRGTWYPNNTSCTFGIHLRDILPQLTNKWYTVTPIDLSQDGVQRYELIGGNMYVIGYVEAKVQGDQLTVTYKLIGGDNSNTRMQQEYLNIFTDVNSITADMLEGDSAAGQGFKYGEPISIQEDLGGDTNVLLYTRNVVTFNTRVRGDRYLTRMWPNIKERRELRDYMTSLMDPVAVP